MEMKKIIFDLSTTVIEVVKKNFDMVNSKRNMGLSKGGDTQFDIDNIAENAVKVYLQNLPIKSALYSEDYGLVKLCAEPEFIFIVDPIDGTRSAAAGLESCCFSVAVTKYSEDIRINDIMYAMLYEFKTKSYFYSDLNSDKVETNMYEIRPSNNESLEKLFWSMEFNGHPARIITNYIGSLIDATANKGGIFIFNSATFSISRILTGQLDAYLDVGNRILRDHPEYNRDFRSVGNGKILHLFPYDIAAAVYIAKKAGIAITDAYGCDLGTTKLLNMDVNNLQSCIAASNWKLHEKLIHTIKW